MWGIEELQGEVVDALGHLVEDTGLEAVKRERGGDAVRTRRPCRGLIGANTF